MTVGGARLGVSIHIGEAVDTVADPAPAGFTSQNAAQARAGALRLPARALDVAQQEITQEQE